MVCLTGLSDKLRVHSFVLHSFNLAHERKNRFDLQLLLPSAADVNYLHLRMMRCTCVSNT